MFKKILVGFIVMGFALTSVPVTSYAGVQVGDNLKLFGDVRVRLEFDERDPATTCNAGLCDSRDRSRIRTRFGAKYQTAFEPLTFGFRLTTGQDRWSPHQNLGLASDTSTRGKDIGLDRAFLKFNFLETGSVVLGKQAFPFWQQTEQFFDADISPGGYAVVYKADIGSMGSLTFGGAYLYLFDADWTENYFENDAMIGWQLLYKGTAMANITPTLAFTSLNTLDPDNFNTTPSDWKDDGKTWDSDDDANAFYMVSAQVKTKIDEIGIQVGFDYHFSDVETTSSSDKNQGYVAHVRAKMGPYGVRYYYHDIEENSVPSALSSPLSQDNFPSGSVAPVGFEGHRLQFDYKFAKGVAADIRYYIMEHKTENVWGESGDRDRLQINLNAKF